MKALRIVLTQSKANYKKEETVENKMTYPLPPFSTVIGALHNACGFKELHKMDISIQGKYESMSREPYTDYCFPDKFEDDRGILVKLKNELLQSTAFDKVASSIKSQGTSFRNRRTIKVYNEVLLDEYCGLKQLNDEIIDFKNKRLKKVKEQMKQRKKTLKDKKKDLKGKTERIKVIDLRSKEIVAKERLINEKLKEFEIENYTKKILKFANITTSLKYYEVLHNIELVIHVKAEKKVLEVIQENIYNLKSIGRSEDFVDVKECCFIDLIESLDKEVSCKYSAYLNYDLVKNNHVALLSKAGIPASGTKY